MIAQKATFVHIAVLRITDSGGLINHTGVIDATRVNPLKVCVKKWGCYVVYWQPRIEQLAVFD